MAKSLRVGFVGLRGFPGVQGGVETHVENLAVNLVSEDFDIYVSCRSPYVSFCSNNYCGVNIFKIWSPRSKYFEAIVHSLFSVLVFFVRYRPQILHVHAIGPGLVVPLARILGFKVVFTHHGADYNREKWGWGAKFILKIGEFLAVRFSNKVIAISKVIKDDLWVRHRVVAELIPNGVGVPDLNTVTDGVTRFGLENRKYLVLVGRIVPEKRHIDLFRAFKAAGVKDWKLVFIGAADHESPYFTDFKKQVLEDPSVVYLGVKTGNDLAVLYKNAGLFVLPSSHEGLPIALLEALSYGLPVIASDIPANLEVSLPSEQYFELGSIQSLADRIKLFSHPRFLASTLIQERVDFVASRYDWKKIASSTAFLYKDILNEEGGS